MHGENMRLLESFRVEELDNIEFFIAELSECVKSVSIDFEYTDSMILSFTIDVKKCPIVSSIDIKELLEAVGLTRYTSIELFCCTFAMDELQVGVEVPRVIEW